MQLTIIRRLAALVAAIAIASAPALAQSPVFLTVTGAVENTNRDAMNPDLDKLFAFNEVSFEAAHEFPLEALHALPQTTLSTDFPAGGATVEFSGPLLADVLDAAGASGATVTVQAIDGYAVDAPMQELTDMGAVVALMRDGAPLGMGGFGPTQIVFPRGERPELAEMPDDWWIWQVFHIKVE